jgi:hypothetical protein
VNEVGQHRALEVVDNCALWDKNDEVVGASAVHFFALPMHAALGTTVRMVLKGKKRGNISVGDEPDIAASATISAVGSALGHMSFTTERNASSATVSAFDI